MAQNTSVEDDSESVTSESTATARTTRPAKLIENMTPEERTRADAMDVRCLSLCIGMLERVMGVCDHLSEYVTNLLTATHRQIGRAHV